LHVFYYNEENGKMSRKIKNLVRLTAVFILCAGLSRCAWPFRFINYSLSDTPRYSLTVDPPYKGLHRDSIRAVSYNIKHSAKIEEAINLLKNNAALADADILLLQEMVPSAVEKIAAELNYNYVFYPAVVHPILHDNFGNAVLSKWPITYDKNTIFPPLKKNGRHRIAVAAKLRINDKDVLVYSLHMGIFMKPGERGQQVQKILNAIDEDVQYCIIAGDFNTISPKDQGEIVATFSEAGFKHATADVDWTYNHWYFLNYKSVFDHIFVRGLDVLEAGKVNDRNASDHLPVWSEFSMRAHLTEKQ
jgi:endonuclease/exonuclease/phosphatase family metal-dependent hydrolase